MDDFEDGRDGLDRASTAVSGPANDDVAIEFRDSAKIEPIEWFNSSNAIMPTTIKGSSSRGGARACRSIVVVFLGFLFLENIVHQSVFDRFLGTEEEIAVGVFGDLLDRFARMF